MPAVNVRLSGLGRPEPSRSCQLYECSGDVVGLSPPVRIRREAAGTNERLERLIEVASGRLHDRHTDPRISPPFLRRGSTPARDETKSGQTCGAPGR